MLSDDINNMDYFFEGNAPLCITIASWKRIKKFCAEALKPSHNKQSTPCYFCQEIDGHKSSCYRLKVAEERETW